MCVIVSPPGKELSTTQNEQGAIKSFSTLAAVGVQHLSWHNVNHQATGLYHSAEKNGNWTAIPRKPIFRLLDFYFLIAQVKYQGPSQSKYLALSLVCKTMIDTSCT